MARQEARFTSHHGIPLRALLGTSKEGIGCKPEHVSINASGKVSVIKNSILKRKSSILSSSADIWSATATGYSTTIVKLTSQGGEALLKLVESVRPFDDSSIVLDSGAGSGALTALLRQKSSNMPIVAADFAPGMLEILAERDLPNVKTVVLDAIEDYTAQGLQENHFTHALTTFMLQFISPAQKAINETYQILQPGGIIGNAIWAYSAVPEIWAKAVKTVDPTFEPPKHMFTEGILSAHDLEEAHTAAGFVDVKTTEVPMLLDFDSAEEFVEYFIKGQNPPFMMTQKSWKSGEAENVREALVRVVREEYSDGRIPFVAACGVGREPGA